MPLDADGREIHVGDYVERIRYTDNFRRWIERNLPHVIPEESHPVSVVTDDFGGAIGIYDDVTVNWDADCFRVSTTPTTVRTMSHKIYREYMKCPT